jgi:RNA polymerase sigma factor (sigma-70 family)
MTDSQSLIREFAESGSETAFRELVTRHINLVYFTALRLVGGDSQLAENVSQTVFINLARKAGTLPRDIMLGGWLHRHTFHIASKAARQEYRRRVRELKAIEMNTLQNNSEEAAQQVKPILDEALMQLSNEDRQAILLRFFEERDFRAVGESLEVSEDAARMRVARAMDKLHFILKRRGAVVPATALGAALGVEAARAVPSGLAAKLAGKAITAAAGGGLMHATFLVRNIMNTTKLKASIAGAIAVTGVVTSLLLQQRATARMNELDDLLRQQSKQSDDLAAENTHLSNRLAQASGAKGQQGELQKLRAAAEALRQKTNELASLREEHQRLRQELHNTAQTALQKKEAMRAKINFEMDFLRAFRIYANNHADQYPTSFDQAAPSLPHGSNAATDATRDDFEWVYQGTDINSTNINDTLVIRETEPWLDSDGQWKKVYGFADGHTQVVTMPSTWNGVAYDSFQSYENDRIAAPSAK